MRLSSRRINETRRFMQMPRFRSLARATGKRNSLGSARASKARKAELRIARVLSWEP